MISMYNTRHILQIFSAFIAAYFIFYDEILASNYHCTTMKIYPCLTRPTILTELHVCIVKLNLMLLIYSNAYDAFFNR